MELWDQEHEFKRSFWVEDNVSHKSERLQSLVGFRQDVVGSGPWCLSETGHLETSLSRAPLDGKRLRLIQSRLEWSNRQANGRNA